MIDKEKIDRYKHLRDKCCFKPNKYYCVGNIVGLLGLQISCSRTSVPKTSFCKSTELNVV